MSFWLHLTNSKTCLFILRLLAFNFCKRSGLGKTKHIVKDIHCQGHPIKQIFCLHKALKKGILIEPIGVSARLDFPRHIRNWKVTISGISCVILKNRKVIKSDSFTFVGCFVKLLFSLIHDLKGWEISINFEQFHVNKDPFLQEFSFVQFLSRGQNVLPESLLQPFNQNRESFIAGRELRFLVVL